MAQLVARLLMPQWQWFNLPQGRNRVGGTRETKSRAGLVFEFFFFLFNSLIFETKHFFFFEKRIKHTMKLGTANFSLLATLLLFCVVFKKKKIKRTTMILALT